MITYYYYYIYKHKPWYYYHPSFMHLDQTYIYFSSERKRKRVVELRHGLTNEEITHRQYPFVPHNNGIWVTWDPCEQAGAAASGHAHTAGR